MRGHIRRTQSGAWELFVELPRDSRTGRRRQHSETFKGSKKEADLRLAELVERIGKNNFVRPTRLVFGEWLKQWFKGYVTTNTSPRTAASYKSEIVNHLLPNLGSLPLSQLEPRHLEEYYARALECGRVDGRAGLSPTSVLYHHRIISEALKHAVKTGYLSRNVAELVTPPRKAWKVMSTLAPNHLPRFLAAIREDPYYVPFYTDFATGLRLSELCGLTWQNIDLDQGFLSVTQTLLKRGGVLRLVEPKTAYSRRRITLPASLARLLREHRLTREEQEASAGRTLEESDFVFSHGGNRPLDPSTVSHSFSRVIREAGLPHLNFHGLRHSHASFLLGAGVDVKAVSERLGHASVAFTMDVYSHVLPTIQAAAAERFDRIILSGIIDGGDIKKLSGLSEDAPFVRNPLGLGTENPPQEGDFESEPPATRTRNRLIKSQLLCQLS